MIMQDILLEKYNWKVVVCFLEKDSDIDDAMDVLSESDCVGTPLIEAYDHISQDIPNVGLTYTNVAKRSSIVIVGKSTSEAECINSITHELFHVVAHICNHLDIDMQGEEPCYLMGWLCQAVL